MIGEEPAEYIADPRTSAHGTVEGRSTMARRRSNAGRGTRPEIRRTSEVTYAWPYVAATGALALVMTAAVWRPRARQVALLLTGPVVTVAALVGPDWGGLGLLGVLVVPFAYLLVPSVLPWAKPWAGWAVPAAVLVACGVLAAPSRFTGPMSLFALPFVLALVALVRALFRLHRPAGPTTSAPGTSHGSPAAGRAVVVVAAIQGAVALLAGGVIAAVLLGPNANTGSTNGLAGLGSALALLFAGIAVAVAAVYVGLAVGLHRRYRDFRYVFTAVQILALAVCVWTGRALWVWALAAWVAATVALAHLGDSVDSPDRVESAHAR
jgi:hypothetical protein